jgi:GntR family transcriptional regulator
MKMPKARLMERIRVVNSGVPRYVQIKHQILSMIGEGLLEPGDQLPTLREMAEAMAIDITTVKRCYDELSQMGAVEIRRPSGTFVSAQPLPGRARTSAELRARTHALARQTLGEAAAQGIDPVALIDEMRAIAGRNEEANDG